MSTQINFSYAKKLSLPHFGSHSFMVTVSAEISSLRRLETEAKRVYALLQNSVDEQLKAVGFLPDTTKYGMLEDGKAVQNGTSKNGHAASMVPASAADALQPSEKQ